MLKVRNFGCMAMHREFDVDVSTSARAAGTPRSESEPLSPNASAIECPPPPHLFACVDTGHR